MTERLESLISDLKDKTFWLTEVVYCTIELRRLYGATIGFGMFFPNVVTTPYSDEYIDNYLRDYAKKINDEFTAEQSNRDHYNFILQKLSCTPAVDNNTSNDTVATKQRFNDTLKNTVLEKIEFYKNRRNSLVDKIVEDCYSENKYSMTANEFRKEIVTHFYDFAEDIYDELYDWLFAEDVELVSAEIENDEDFIEDETDCWDAEEYMDELKDDGRQEWKKILNTADNNNKSYGNPEYLHDNSVWWDIDLGYNVETVKQYLFAAYNPKYQDDYTNEDRLFYFNLINECAKSGQIDCSKLVSICAELYKNNSFTQTETVRIVGEKKKRTEVTTEKFVKPTYQTHNNHTPADPIRNAEDVKRIKEYFLTHGKECYRKRNHAIFCLGISTGMRASDLLALRISDVLGEDDIANEIVFREKKTGNIEHAQLNSDIQEILRDYLQSFEHEDEDGYLFPSQSMYGRLGVKQLYRMFKNVQDDLHLGFHFSTHSLRKTFAYWTIRMHYYDQNIIFSLQDMLNHRDIKNTLYYSGHTKDHLKTLYDDMGKVLNGTVEDTPAISTQEQKINQILDMLTKQIGEHTTSDEE
jgi:integrase